MMMGFVMVVIWKMVKSGCICAGSPILLSHIVQWIFDIISTEMRHKDFRATSFDKMNTVLGYFGSSLHHCYSTFQP